MIKHLLIFLLCIEDDNEVVFAEKGDLLLLGARTLEGLNLVVDSTKKKLVAA